MQSVTASNTNTNTHQVNNDSSTVNNNNKTCNENDATNKLDTVFMALNPEPNIPKKSKCSLMYTISLLIHTLSSP